MIRTLIVDDVPLARARLVRLLSSEPDVRVVGEAAEVESALDRAQRGDVDLVLLDIGLPDGSGLDLLRHLEAWVPHVIFLTAYSEHALRAWEIGALDYLLKPVDAERLQLALRRVRDRRSSEAPRTSRLAVRSGHQTVFLSPPEIDYLDVAGHYVCIHAGRSVHLHRDSIANVAGLLAPHGFVRIHRSSAVNVARVVALTAGRNQDAQVTLLDGTVLRVSRQYRAQLAAALPHLP